MNYLLDTNIILLYLRENKRLADKIDFHYAPFDAPNVSLLPVVSVGEIRSIAIQSQWGNKRINYLDRFISKFPIADIHVETILAQYAEIDAFSQGKLPDKPLGMSARNMGKNDLWIAAIASVLGLTLLTTDSDFEHLNGQFLKVEWIDLNAL